MHDFSPFPCSSYPHCGRCPLEVDTYSGGWRRLA